MTPIPPSRVHIVLDWHSWLVGVIWIKKHWWAMHLGPIELIVFAENPYLTKERDMTV